MRWVPGIAPHHPSSPRRVSSFTAETIKPAPLPRLAHWPNFQGLMSEMASRLKMIPGHSIALWEWLVMPPGLAIRQLQI